MTTRPRPSRCMRAASPTRSWKAATPPAATSSRPCPKAATSSSRCRKAPARRSRPGPKEGALGPLFWLRHNKASGQLLASTESKAFTPNIELNDRRYEMAAITASMVGELRAKTDAPMMECKKALTESEGNMERAEEILRVKLGNKAGKAASRVTAEGVIASVVTGSTGALIEVNCETDFVSKNDSFLGFVKSCAVLVAE